MERVGVKLDSVGERHNEHDDGHFSFHMASEGTQTRGKTA
jgi:hypothetical protein